MHYIKLFAMGMIQIFCIVTTTYLISHNMMGWAVISQFFITYVWTYNVQKMAMSQQSEKFVHALGAMAGSGLVWIITSLFNQ